MKNPTGADLKTAPSSVSPTRQFLRRVVVQLLRLRVWLTETGPADLWDSNYFWAIMVGLCGACSSVVFREALNHLQWLLLRYRGPLDDAGTSLPWWGRLLMPAVGGVLAELGDHLISFGVRHPVVVVPSGRPRPCVSGLCRTFP